MTRTLQRGALALACLFVSVAALAQSSGSTVTTNARAVWRDWTVDGVPSSGVWNPLKSDIRAWGALVGGQLNSLQGAQVGGTLAFDTKANLDATLAYPANSMAFVFADATSANNGVYRKSGASGAGSWAKVSSLIYGPQPVFSVAGSFSTNPADAAVSIGGSPTSPLISFVVPRGTLIHSTSGTPSTGLGLNGDYAIDPSNYTLWGPKAAGVWPAPSATAQGAAAAAASSASAAAVSASAAAASAAAAAAPATSTTRGGVYVPGGANLTLAGDGALSLSGANVGAALGYTPVNKAGDAMTGGLSTTGGLASNNLLLQGDGANGYIRPTNAPGSLYLGAANQNLGIITNTGHWGFGNLNPASAGGRFVFDYTANGNGNLRVVNGSSGADAMASVEYVSGIANSYAITSLRNNGGLPYFLIGTGPAVTEGILYDSVRHVFRDEAGVEAMRIVNDNVGIGAITPLTKFMVAKDSNPVASEPFGDFQGNGQLFVTGKTNTAKRLALGVDTTVTPMAGVIQSIEAGTALRNLALNPSGGNVGIGMIDPPSKLSVTGNGYFNGALGIGTPSPRGSLEVAAAAPSTVFTNTSGATNEKTYDWHSNSGVLYGRMLNDAFSDARHWIEISRSGINPTQVGFPNGVVDIGGLGSTHKFNVNGNAGLAAGGYLNFGTADGAAGYGIRDNAGSIECKNSGGSWATCGGGGGGSPAGLTAWKNMKSDCGAAGNGSTDDLAAINSCVADANSTGVSLYFPPGTYRVSAPINEITRSGVRIKGDGRNSTIIAAAFAGGDTLTSNAQFTSVEDLSLTPSVFKTSGYELVVKNGFNNVIRNVYVNGGFRGIQVLSTASPFLENIGMRYLTGDIGLYFTGTASVSSYGMYAKNMVADNPYAVPIFNENLKSWGNSTAYAVGDAFTVSGWIWQVVVAGTSQSSGLPAAPTAAGWNLTNVASGSAQLRPIARTSLTWVYMDSYANSLVGVSFALLNGARGFAMTDNANTTGSYPSWAYFYDLEVDHAYFTGVDISGGVGFHATNAWVGSTLTGNALFFGGAFKGEATVTASRIVANGQHGVLLNAGDDVKIQGNIIANNSVNAANTYHGVVVAANINRFTIQNNSTGVVRPFTTSNQGWGVIVLPGSSNYYLIQGNLGFGNVSGSVSDGGSGANKSVSGNI